MLLKRILSGVIFAPLIALLALHPISFFILVCVIAVLLVIEFYRLAELIGARSSKSVGIIFCLLFCLAAFISKRKAFLSFSLNWTAPELFIYLTILVSFAHQIIKRDANSAFLTISISSLGIIYIGWAFSRHLILVREMENGVGLIFLFIAIIWCGDTGAYAIGRLLGRHKLIPAISPGKTIEGAIGGLFFGALGGIAIKYAFLAKVIALHHVIVLGLLLGIIGQISDLGESLLKRNANVKDSGNLIPGHGGLLDRCDSMILTAPVFYYYLKYLLHVA